MPLMSIFYANDKDLLTEINVALAEHVKASEEPAEVDSPETLNLDWVSIGKMLWQLPVVFESINQSIEGIKTIVNVLRKRTTKATATKVEFTVPSGINITLEGSMTPEQVAKEIKRYKLALKTSKKTTIS